MIELMSCLNIEDFQANQWIFLVDGFGMKFEMEGRQVPQSIPKGISKKALEAGLNGESKKEGIF